MISLPDNTALQYPENDLIAGNDKDAKEGRYDPLADMVMRRWWDANQWMQSEYLGDACIAETLLRCYRQRAGIYDPEDAGLLDGIDVFIPLTDMKCMAAEAWMRDMLMAAIDLPWTIDPTPIPELPERLKAKVLRDLKMEIAGAASGGDPMAAAKQFGAMPREAANMAFGGMISSYPGDLQKVAAQLKESQRTIAMAEAVKASKKMERLMKDQTVQMDFDKVMLAFFHDVVTYPAAILKGPVMVNRPAARWEGNRRVVTNEPQLSAYRVSPFDFFPSPDSPDTQHGSYVLERFRMNKRSLSVARGQKYWIAPNIDIVLAQYSNARQWLLMNMRRSPERQQNFGPWDQDLAIDALDHHGIVSGRELRRYGFSADEKSFYEARVVVCGRYTLAVQVYGEPNQQLRPYHSTSYEKKGEQFWNMCPTMKLRAVQRTVNAAVRSQIRNMAFSSGPMAEIDVARVQRYVATLEELTHIQPFQARLVDPDMLNGGRPAYTFTNVPATIAPLLQTIQYYFKMADDVSNIPSYAQGETGLSGAGRTFRGFSAVFAQALKVFKMPVQNMDVDIFQPFATMLFDHNMEYSKDDSVKGDARVYARGAQGLVEREMAEQKQLETLQIVAQMAPAVVQADPQGSAKLLKYAWAKAMQALGIPVESFGVNPDLDAAMGSESQQGQDFAPQTPIPSIGQTPSPG